MVQQCSADVGHGSLQSVRACSTARGRTPSGARRHGCLGRRLHRTIRARRGFTRTAPRRANARRRCRARTAAAAAATAADQRKALLRGAGGGRVREAAADEGRRAPRRRARRVVPTGPARLPHLRPQPGPGSCTSRRAGHGRGVPQQRQHDARLRGARRAARPPRRREHRHYSPLRRRAAAALINFFRSRRAAAGAVRRVPRTAPAAGRVGAAARTRVETALLLEPARRRVQRRDLRAHDAALPVRSWERFHGRPLRLLRRRRRGPLPRAVRGYGHLLPRRRDQPARRREGIFWLPVRPDGPVPRK